MKIYPVILANNLPFGRFPSITTEYGLDAMVDTRECERVNIWLTSTLNQAVTVQLVGCDENLPLALTRQVDLGGTDTVADGSTTASRLLKTLELRASSPEYVGLTVLTGGTAPTAGRLIAVASQWVPETEELLRMIGGLLTQMASWYKAGGPGHYDGGPNGPGPDHYPWTWETWRRR